MLVPVTMNDMRGIKIFLKISLPVITLIWLDLEMTEFGLVIQVGEKRFVV